MVFKESKIRFHSLMSDTRFLLLSMQVSTKLRELSYYRDDNTVFFTTLAEQVEDFSVTLMDQINTKEENSIEHEEISDMDPYASLLDSITESAIHFSQKKVYKLYNDIWLLDLNVQQKLLSTMLLYNKVFIRFLRHRISQGADKYWDFSGYEKGYDFCTVWSENGYIV